MEVQSLAEDERVVGFVAAFGDVVEAIDDDLEFKQGVVRRNGSGVEDLWMEATDEPGLHGEVVLFAVVRAVELLGGFEEFVAAVAGYGGGLFEELFFVGVGHRLEVASDGDFGF